MSCPLIIINKGKIAPLAPYFPRACLQVLAANAVALMHYSSLVINCMLCYTCRQHISISALFQTLAELHDINFIQ